MGSDHKGKHGKLDDVGQHDQSRDEPRLEPKHKIFLSHSGAQKNFTWQLCEDLIGVHHCPFFDKRDDCLPKGKIYAPLLIKAANQCRVAIVVLSEEFFTRGKWPMIELNEFVQAQASTNSRLEILPLFLGITVKQFKDPVRRQGWEKVWRKWAAKDRSIDVKKWVHALSVVGRFNGIEYDNAMGHVAYRKEVKAAVCKMVPPDIKWDVSHVQSAARLCEPILRKMDAAAALNCGARVVGLYGTGGVGKTTIAKVLCNQMFGEFGGKVCLVELGPNKDLVKSLRQVLVELTGGSEWKLPKEAGKIQALRRNGLIEDVREVGPLIIKIQDLYVDFAKEKARAGTFEERRFLCHMGGTDFPPELLMNSSGSCWARLERLVIRNCDLRSLKEANLHRCSNVEVLQLIDCKLLEEVDVKGMKNLISLEVSGCPGLGKDFKGVEQLGNLAWLSWNDICKHAPFLDRLSYFTELRRIELTFLARSKL